MTKEQKRHFVDIIKTTPWRKKLVYIPFLICAIFLLLVGKVFRLTYKEISVVFNLWIQGTVLVVSSLLPFASSMYAIIVNHSWQNVCITVFFLVYVVINVVAFVAMLRHYGKNMNVAFDKCVEDLERIALSWKMSYHMVNLLIFILFYLMLIAINIAMSHYVILLNAIS